MKYVEVMSILVASGYASRCNEVVSEMRQNLILRDDDSGQTKTYLFKYGKQTDREGFKRVAREMADLILPKLDGIPSKFKNREIKNAN
jgi:hypothetical protein